jgi:hypothetical protein
MINYRGFLGLNMKWKRALHGLLFADLMLALILLSVECIGKLNAIPR